MTEETKRGRPPLPVRKRKRNNLTFRTRDGLRAALAQAAVDNGRSISEEIEFRLERSLTADAPARNEHTPVLDKFYRDLTNRLEKVVRKAMRGGESVDDALLPE